MMRLPAVLALIAVSTTGCSMSSNQKAGTIVGGLATGAVGALIYSAGAVDADHNGVNENPLDDNWGAYMLGGMMVTAGLGMLIAGLTATAVDETPAPAQQRVVYAYAPQPMTVIPQQGQRAALPELPTNGDAIQAAQQIRSLAENGQCGAAWTTWHRLDVADHAYAVAVRDGAVMAPCPVNVVAPML